MAGAELFCYESLLPSYPSFDHLVADVTEFLQRAEYHGCFWWGDIATADGGRWSQTRL